MDTINKICALLQSKKDLFLRYEEATQALLDSDETTAPDYITQREELANKIDSITLEIGRLSDRQENADLLMSIAAGRTRFENVPVDYRPVYEEASEIQSVAFRIQEQEKSAVHRFESLRDAAMSKIKENQNLPKIKKYLDDLQEKPRQGGFANGKA